MILSSNNVVSGSKNLRFIKEQQTSKISDNMLGNKMQVVGDISIALEVLKSYTKYKMDEIVNILLAGDKVMPEMHLRHSGFIYKVCGPVIRNKKIQKLKET